jgi:hypothetical protein
MSPSDTPQASLHHAAQSIWEQIQKIDQSAGMKDVTDETIQTLITVAVKLFSGKIDASQTTFSPVRAGADLTATEVAVLTVELMHAVNLNLFDLSMWASRPRD